MKKQIIVEDAENIISESLPYEKFYRKTVLISGANGYVPAYFVHSFLMLNDKCDANIKVIALCRNEERAKQRFEDYIDRSDFELLIQDVKDQINIDTPIHFFIHAASPAGIRSRHDDPVNTFQANVKGAENMLELAIKNPCEGFLFLSSVDVYGKMSDNERLSEERFGYLDPLNMRNVYSCGKRAAEALCIAYRAKYNLPVYIVRPFQIIGPGPELNDGRLHIDFISQLLKERRIVLKSDGVAVRSFLYIADAIKAIFYVLLLGEPGIAYNIVDEKCEASVKELAGMMASVAGLGENAVVFDYDARTSIEVTAALSVVTGCADRLKKLGWTSKYSVKEASARMMEYYGIETTV